MPPRFVAYADNFSRCTGPRWRVFHAISSDYEQFFSTSPQFRAHNSKVQTSPSIQIGLVGVHLPACPRLALCLRHVLQTELHRFGCETNGLRWGLTQSAIAARSALCGLRSGHDRQAAELHRHSRHKRNNCPRRTATVRNSGSTRNGSRQYEVINRRKKCRRCTTMFLSWWAIPRW